MTTPAKLSLGLFLLALPLLGLSCGSKSVRDGGVYKSTDGGETWEQKVKIDAKNSIASLSVSEIAIDSNDSNLVLLGTKENGIYKSTDGGETWKQTSLKGGTIYSLQFNPNDSSVVYAGGSNADTGKIYKSSDNGNNWEEVYSETHDDTVINEIAVDWYDSRRVYAGTSFGVLLKSKDSGRSWVAVHWFEEGESVNHLAISYKDSRQLFLATNKSLYQSGDGGGTVNDLSQGLANFGKATNILDLVTHPQ